MSPLRGSPRLLVAVLVLLAACAVPARPPGPPAGPPDLPARIDRFLDASRTGRFEQVRALVVDVAGERRYVRGDPTAHVDVRSVTKSVVSTLVGIAIDEGKIRSVDQTLAELLPTSVAAMPVPLRAARLRDLLTMSAGTAPDRSSEGHPPAPDEDAVTHALTLGPQTRPATGFEYSSAGSHLLSAILVQATGRPVLDYGRDTLFGPLGIGTDPAAGFAWASDAQGRQAGDTGLVLSADDLVALGRLLLAGGRRDGRQVVSPGWITEATRGHVRTDLPLPAYGYQWWVTDAAGHPAFVAQGYGGQVLEVVPDLQLVVVVTSDVGPVAGADGVAFAELVDTVVAPAIG